MLYRCRHIADLHRNPEDHDGARATGELESLGARDSEAGPSDRAHEHRISERQQHAPIAGCRHDVHLLHGQRLRREGRDMQLVHEERPVLGSRDRRWLRDAKLEEWWQRGALCRRRGRRGGGDEYQAERSHSARRHRNPVHAEK